MKIALVTDIHFGVKAASDVFLNSQLKFFREQFIPELISKDIDTIFILGDLFDNRVHINSKILNEILTLFRDDLANFKIHIIVGNHDSFLESSVHINSVNTLALLPNVNVYSETQSIEFADKKILMCPWITNSKQFIEYLDTIEHHNLCFGHFNFINFKMFKNQEADHGLEPTKFFEKFDLTISGHFHTRSSRKIGNSEVLYMGNPFHFTRNDIGDDRGYLILDTETNAYEFVNNTKSLKFVSVNYPDSVSQEDIEGNHVDLYVKYDTTYDEYKIQTYLEKLESYKPAFPVSVKTLNKIDVENPDELNIIGSAEELFEEYFSTAELPEKDKTKALILELYAECKNDI